ncbi:SprT family protein [Thalassobacillus pellis]|uniref:SprT family protein n=1 Tax=Thalassobacillus pellis TaxID=748008 RepID=UPI00196118AF|nr:SprT family protein [Thalassobacillus pellis]MBM7554404.1 SprT-like protein [Thalassobacillus pellis]
MDQMDKQQLKKLTEKLSQEYFGKPFIDEVCFNNRLRTTGGRYIPSKRTIEINPKYLQEAGEDEFIGIIKHELCHYHLHIEGKGYKHRDRAFRELLKRTGSPRYCSQLPSQAAKRKHIYTCVKCGQVYRRVRRIDTKRYRCGKCRGNLKKSRETIDEK